MTEHFSRALGHPLRHRLLFEYLSGPVSPGELARRLGEPVNRVAYHTGVLVRGGLIELASVERRRGALTHFYRASIFPEIDGGDWEMLPVELRRSLTLGLLQLTMAEARRAALDGGFDDRETYITRLPMLLDEPGIEAVGALLRTTYTQLQGLVGAHLNPNERTQYEIALLAYERAS
jgi:DNA-binding transcriptional ArsR family regulator